jgi:FKBP-type peptidyl-prolyl cis-trans isomerase FklB
MKKLSILFVLAFATTALAQDAKRPDLKDERDKVSYSIGLDIGNTFKNQKMDINTDVLLMGLRDAQSGAKPLLTDDQVKETMNNYAKSMREKQATEMKEAGKKNQEIGDKFLAENKKKEGVKTTQSGLQYRVLQEGKGDHPTLQDTVEVHYRGTLIDGKEFDSSYERGQPATFPLAGVIPGWTEALQLMRPGAKFQLAIPPHLAYGDRGAGADIGPGSTLLFDVELLSIKPKAEQTQPLPTPETK